MEKAILKTLIYADIFDYPLTIFEIHKWLVGRKVTFRQVEEALEKLRVKGKTARVKGYYFLPDRAGIVRKRQQREKQSAWYIKKGQLLTQMLKFIPWIKLVGISGGLAMGNASKIDDIDLFIVTAKNRLWMSRLFALGVLSLLGQRRKVADMGRKIAGKLCLNILLEEDRLEQSSIDIYLAHEVLQMRVLWQRDGIYRKYLEDNQWAFKFLPNWTSSLSFPRKRESISSSGMTDYLETLAKWFQLKIMQKPQGMERIEDGALYFHPNDIRSQILSEYKQRLKKLSNS